VLLILKKKEKLDAHHGCNILNSIYLCILYKKLIFIYYSANNKSQKESLINTVCTYYYSFGGHIIAAPV
jgi:hypothetical protein